MRAAVTAPPSANTTTGKDFATLQARCALAGIVLHQLTGDDGRPEYIATRWAMTKAFHDLPAVAEWLVRVSPRREPAA